MHKKAIDQVLLKLLDQKLQFRFTKNLLERMKQNLGEEKIKTGKFGAMMQVKIINDGPVTILIESKNQDKN